MLYNQRKLQSEIMWKLIFFKDGRRLKFEGKEAVGRNVLKKYKKGN